MPMKVIAIGVCVSDLERSKAWWCDGLGFVPKWGLEGGREFADALEIGGDVELTAQFVERDGVMLELLHYARPGASGVPSNRRNLLGFTHLSIEVDDVDEVAQRLVELGGEMIPSTRTHFGTGELMFVADPDGVRVELCHYFAPEGPEHPS